MPCASQPWTAGNSCRSGSTTSAAPTRCRCTGPACGCARCTCSRDEQRDLWVQPQYAVSRDLCRDVVASSGRPEAAGDALPDRPERPQNALGERKTAKTAKNRPVVGFGTRWDALEIWFLRPQDARVRSLFRSLPVRTLTGPGQPCTCRQQADCGSHSVKVVGTSRWVTSHDLSKADSGHGLACKMRCSRQELGGLQDDDSVRMSGLQAVRVRG